jgi:hypothetical protein
MSYLTDPDFDKKMKDLHDFLKDCLDGLHDDEIFEDPDEFSPEAIFGDKFNKE